MPNPIMNWLRGNDLKATSPWTELEQAKRAAYTQGEIAETRTRLLNELKQWDAEAQRLNLPVQERKLYMYQDFLDPGIATDIGGAIRLGTLVHGPGATEMIYRAFHHEDSNSAVYACLTAICTAYPEAPLKVFRETEPGERDHLAEHPLQKLLDSPNPFLTREHLWHYVQWCKHVDGNAYLRKIRAGIGLPTQLWPISPTRLIPITTKEDAARGVFISYYAYKYDLSKEPELISPNDIIHFRMGIDDRDHRLGASPLSKLVREVMGDDIATEWQNSMLDNGAIPGLVVQGPEASTFTEAQAKDIVDGIQERFGGTKRGRVGMLTGGATIQQVGFSPEQMDMKALHRIPEERIAAVMRVPAIIAGLGAGLDRSTYANFREAREMFAEMTILPLYSFDAAVVNMQLLPEFATDRKIKTAFDTTDLRALQEDEDAKWARLDKAVKTGWVRPNEARSDVGLKPDMDDDEVANRQQPMLKPGDEQPALPPGEEEEPKEKRLGETKARRIEQLPVVMQHAVDRFEQAFERELEAYADRQRKTVRRRLIAGGG